MAIGRGGEKMYSGVVAGGARWVTRGSRRARASSGRGLGGATRAPRGVRAGEHRGGGVVQVDDGPGARGSDQKEGPGVEFRDATPQRAENIKGLRLTDSGVEADSAPGTPSRRVPPRPERRRRRASSRPREGSARSDHGGDGGWGDDGPGNIVGAGRVTAPGADSNLNDLATRRARAEALSATRERDLLRLEVRRSRRSSRGEGAAAGERGAARGGRRSGGRLRRRVATVGGVARPLNPRPPARPRRPDARTRPRARRSGDGGGCGGARGGGGCQRRRRARGEGGGARGEGCPRRV